MEKINELIGNTKIYYCLDCGKCTACCQVARTNCGYSPRILAQKIILERERKWKEVFDDIWLCTTCYECYEKCPQNVHITDMILELRNMSLDEGLLLEEIRNKFETLQKEGRLAPITKITEKQRSKLNLPKCPKPNIEELEKILKETKIKDRLGKCYAE